MEESSWNNIENIRKTKKKSQQHMEFPSGHPSKYYPCPTQLNFGDQTRTSGPCVVWPLAVMVKSITSISL